jgi:hypothetical protein
MDLIKVQYELLELRSAPRMDLITNESAVHVAVRTCLGGRRRERRFGRRLQLHLRNHQTKQQQRQQRQHRHLERPASLAF